MSTQTAVIDRAGRITLPRQALDALGVSAEAEVVIETTDAGLLLRARRSPTPLTDAIAAMSLPVAGWEQMEAESQEGRVS